ncbi:MAG: GTP-binding protein [Anaerolineales bacterium]|nr:GTP-binding protein [Anaerolineales bacterium]
MGKTSLVRRFVEGRFDDKYLSTIGVKVSRKVLGRETHQLNLLVWDLVGGNDFSWRETGYLIGTAGALVVCDLTRIETLQALDRYTHHLRTVNPRVALLFVGNKLDLSAERQVSDDELMMAAARLGGRYLLTSAKTGTGVEAAFAALADLIEGEG